MHDHDSAARDRAQENAGVKVVYNDHNFLGSCPQKGEDDELQSVYEQLAAAQAEIIELKRALRDSAAYLQVICDHFSHAFPEDCETRKFVANIWLKSKSD
jgi:hypothetical protein